MNSMNSQVVVDIGTSPDNIDILFGILSSVHYDMMCSNRSLTVKCNTALVVEYNLAVIPVLFLLLLSSQGAVDNSHIFAGKNIRLAFEEIVGDSSSVKQLGQLPKPKIG